MNAGVAMSLPVLSVSLAATLLGCTSDADPCGDAQTCIRVDVHSVQIETIDQLELDLVYGSVHTTTTTGVRGTLLDLPVSTALILDLPGPLIDIQFVAAARLNGSVLGADFARVTVQSGHQSTAFVELSPIEAASRARSTATGSARSTQTSVRSTSATTAYRCTTRDAPPPAQDFESPAAPAMAPAACAATPAPTAAAT
ncbi:MAG: hypothetical protein ACREBE_27500 [bacterium]